MQDRAFPCTGRADQNVAVHENRYKKGRSGSQWWVEIVLVILSEKDKMKTFVGLLRDIVEDQWGRRWIMTSRLSL